MPQFVDSIRRAGAWFWLAALAMLALIAAALGAVFGDHSVAYKIAPSSATVSEGYAPSAPVSRISKLKLSVSKGATAGVIAPASDRSRSAVGARQMARKATVSLLVGDVGRAIADLESLARATSGDVTNLDDQRPASANERREANLTLVVPSNRFESTLGRLAKLGGVRSENVSAEDVGDQIVDQEARLRNLRRTEGDLLKIMDRSGKVGEVLEVENQLSDVREQIEKLDAETQALKARVATSTIDVHLEEEIRMIGAEPNAASQLGDAWASAWHASREAALGIMARIFFLIAFSPYWLTLLGIGALIIVLARRRRPGEETV